MRKYVLVLIILLLVSMVSTVGMVSMVGVGPVAANPETNLYVDPPNILNSAMQPLPVETIRPTADGAFKDWTRRNVTIGPDNDGAYKEWTGRILTLNPDGHGKYSEWSSWTHLQPNDNGNYTDWNGGFFWWKDENTWPNHDGDETKVWVDKPNQNETSAVAPVLISDPLIAVRRALPINNVKLTIFAKKNITDCDEKLTMMIAVPFEANVTGRVVDAGWNGWSRNGTSPWLNLADYPSNYIYTNVTNDRIGNFTFQGVPPGIFARATTGIDTVPLLAVTLRLKVWKSPGGDDKVRVYLYNGTKWTSFLPTITGIAESYVEIDVSDYVKTEAAFNATKMALEKVTYGTEDFIYVDHAYLRVQGVRYYGLTTGLTTTYTSYTSEWSTNPVTRSAWTWKDIVALEAGVSSVLGPDNVWTGELRVTLLYVSVLTGGLYTDLDDWPSHNGDTDYVFATAGPKLQSSALTNHTSEKWDILKVRVTIFARNLSITDEKLQIMLVVGGTPYLGSDITFTKADTSWKECTYEWTSNPFNGSDWNWWNIDRLEAGVKSVQVGGWTGEFRVTQLYVKVIESGTYAHWDDTKQDGDDTYVSAIFNNKRQSSTLQDSSATFPISRVQVSIVARTDVSTDEQIKIMIIVAGTPYYSSGFGLTTTYKTYSAVWKMNAKYPSIPWNWTAINALEAGVLSFQFGLSWMGEIRVTQLYIVVGEDGTYTEWNETTQDKDSTYVSATMEGMKESSVLADPTHRTWDIARVRVVVYARATETTDEKVQPILVIGGTAYLAGAGATEYIPTTDPNYAKYTGDWGANPKTKLNWTWTDMDTLEAGVQSKMGDSKIWAGEIRVTQLYVEIAGPRFIVNVSVTNVNQLTGFEFNLTYTTTVLSATNITVGSFFPTNSFIGGREINDEAGYVRYMVTLPMTPAWKFGINGSGVLATIIFLVDDYGATVLDLHDIKLPAKNPAGSITPDNIYYGFFSNKITGDVNGDKKVDASDLSDFGLLYGSTEAQPNWKSQAIFGDFNRDNKVDVSDLYNLSRNYGKSI